MSDFSLHPNLSRRSDALIQECYREAAAGGFFLSNYASQFLELAVRSFLDESALYHRIPAMQLVEQVVPLFQSLMQNGRHVRRHIENGTVMPMDELVYDFGEVFHPQYLNLGFIRDKPEA
ncbi:MAG: hypothetical protein JWL77_2025 [Chthonomonadaceae bacterium]|nr:hypothetical protein [Chthonomonadaceae bacterium]